MASVTLEKLRARVRARADMEDSSFVDDGADSLDAFINAALDELYDILVAGDEDRYVKDTPEAVVLAAGTDAYALPADFYSAWRVEVQQGTEYVQLGRLKKNGASFGRTTNVLTSMEYMIRGTKLVFLPGPAAAGAARLWYIPTRTLLVNAADTFDAVSGWERFVIAKAAVDCLDKEESDTSVLEREVERQRMRIERLATRRDVGEVARVQDKSGGAWSEEDELLE